MQLSQFRPLRIRETEMQMLSIAGEDNGIKLAQVFVPLIPWIGLLDELIEEYRDHIRLKNYGQQYTSYRAPQMGLMSDPK